MHSGYQTIPFSKNSAYYIQIFMVLSPDFGMSRIFPVSLIFIFEQLLAKQKSGTL